MDLPVHFPYRSFAHSSTLAKLLRPLLLLGLCQCTASAASTAKLYMARGQTALAFEYWGLAVAASPTNDKVRAEAMVAHALQNHELTQGVTELTEAKRPIRALGFVITLEEAAAMGQQMKLSGDDPASFVAQRRALTQAAVDALQKDLDLRLARGLPELRDLATCDALKGLATDDADVARMCERLLGNFRHVAVLKAAPGSYASTPVVMAQAAEAIVQQHAELLGIAAQPDMQNALLEIYIGTPVTRSQDWTLEKRDAYHTAVLKVNAKGQQIVEHVTIQPTAQEVAEAAKNKRPAPQPRQETKNIYEQVAGEYRYFRAARQTTVPYRATLTDLRTNMVVTQVADKLEMNTESRYHTYSGDPRARHHPEPTGPTQRESAPPLATEAQLIEQAMRGIPTHLSQALVADLE